MLYRRSGKCEMIRSFMLDAKVSIEQCISERTHKSDVLRFWVKM